MATQEELLADLEEIQEEETSDEEEEEEEEEETLCKDLEDFKVLYSDFLFQVMQKISDYKDDDNLVLVQNDPRYQLLVQANKLSVEIDDEIVHLHKFIRDKYSTKFPELEGSVLSAMDYVKAVKAIGNETDLTKVDLSAILAPSTVMVVTVAASTTLGSPLSEQNLTKVMNACEMVMELEKIRHKILVFVEGRMNLIAPNLSAVVGTRTAAKLMGAAGGLAQLSNLAGGYIQVMGAVKKNLVGFSSANVKQHTGFVYQTEFIQRLPKDLRVKAQRVMANKCALTARIDSQREYRDGSIGKQFRQEIEKKFEKFQEPPPLKKVKPLPAPTEGRKNKRGGKRVRRLKELYGMTEMRKLQNRVTFGVAEEEVFVGDTVKGLGQLTGGSGKVRGPIADTKLRNNMKKQAKPMKMSSNSDGLATTISFTPVQGFELFNPEMANENKDKKFGSGSFKKPLPINKQ